MNSKNIKDYGYTDFYKGQIRELNISDTELIPARIIEIHYSF